MKSIRTGHFFAALIVLSAFTAALAAQETPPPPKVRTVLCESKSGERMHCPADTCGR